MSLDDSPLSPEPAPASGAAASSNNTADEAPQTTDFTPHATDATASSIEQIQQILGESSPAKKEPWLKKLFGRIDHDVKGEGW
jgi:peptidoglycan hydrolase-like protein with peptidoglycan-binding domain